MLALYGGSFDPPHVGHAKAIVAAANEINIEKVDFLPCARSPLKERTGASDEQRLAMLQSMCKTFNDSQTSVVLGVNTTELSLPSPSYTMNTLRVLRKQFGQSIPLIFFLGEDSLYTLHKWKDWRNLCDLCHLAVLRRESRSTGINSELPSWLDSKLKDDKHLLHTLPNGIVYMCDTPLVTISSTEIRTELTKNTDEPANWLTPDVFDYIKKHHIY